MTSIGSPSSTINTNAQRDVARETVTPTLTPTASVEQTAAARAAVVEQATDVTAARGTTGQAFLDTARAVTAASPALPASAASPAELYGPPAPPAEIGLLGQLGGVATGAWGGVTDLAGSLKDMGVGAFNLTGLNGAEAQAQTQASLARTADVIVNNPGAVLDAVTRPVTEPWSQGRYGEAIGRGAFEVASLVVGAKGVDKAGRLGTAARAADTVADTARVADTAADTARVATATNTARVADTAADASRVVEQAGDIDVGVGAIGGSNRANVVGNVRASDAAAALRRNGIADARVWNQELGGTTARAATDIDVMATFPDGRYGILVGGDAKGMRNGVFSPETMAQSLEAVRTARGILTDPDELGRAFVGVKVMVPANTNRQVIDAFVNEVGAANVIPF